MNDASADPVAAAARWYARVHAGAPSDADVAAFDAWLRADAAHAAAWDQVVRTGAALDDMADDPAIAALRREALGIGSPRQAPYDGARRAAMWRLAAAAAVVAAVGTAGIVGLGTATTPQPDVAPTRYATATGKIRTVRLPDGTSMTLDAQSRAEVAVPGATRRVSVEAGRAMFAVAKDRAHPFVVTVGSTSVTALGTHFSVERRGTDNVVALTEGSVRVTAPAGTRTLSPGEVLTVGQRRLSVTTGADDESRWVDGQLVFAAVPLGQVAETLNRYHARRLVIRDAALAAQPYSGALRTADGDDALIAALTATGMARIVARDDASVTLAAR